MGWRHVWVHTGPKLSFTLAMIMKRQPKNPFRKRLSSRVINLARFTWKTGPVLARRNRIHKGFNTLDRQFQRILRHVGETDPEPTRFDAVARRTGRDIQTHLVHYLLPQLHFRFKTLRPQQMPHVHPAEQTGVALEARDPGGSQASDQLCMPFLEPSPVLTNIVFRKLLVREHRGEKVLSLWRN